MIKENPDEQKEHGKIPDVDENGEPLYKIDSESSELPDDQLDKSEFKDTPQDLKDETSQE